MPLYGIAHQSDLPPGQVADALQALAWHDVVIEREGQWQFAVELMRRWVAEFKS